MITFEELAGMFDAKEIDFNTYEKEEELNDAFGAGRGYAVASGVAGAIKACIDEYYPGTEVKIDHVEGLADCKKMLLQAKERKKKGGLIMAQQVQSEIRYLTPPSVDVKKKKYCRFKKSGIKYIDYKDPEFLKKFLNEQGKILPRRITGALCN